MPNWKKEYERKLAAIKHSNVILIEYASGRAVVIPRGTHPDDVAAMAEAQVKRANVLMKD